MKRIELESVRKIYNDRMYIEVGSIKEVVFRVRIDGSNNEFRINKERLREFIGKNDQHQI